MNKIHFNLYACMDDYNKDMEELQYQRTNIWVKFTNTVSRQYMQIKRKKARQLHSSQKIALTERRLSSEIILKAIERVTKLDKKKSIAYTFINCTEDQRHDWYSGDLRLACEVRWGRKKKISNTNKCKI